MPPRQRSRLVTRLIENELRKESDALAQACRKANSDKALNQEIDEWQSFAVIDQVRAVAKHRLQSKLNKASVDDLAEVEAALKVALQLA